MESTTKNMINISKYLTNILQNAIFECLKDYVPQKFQAKVTWNNINTSDLTSPAAMQIYNMNNKKKDFPYPSAKAVAEEILKHIKDEKGLIGEIKVTVSEPPQKKDKKEEKKEEEKKEEEKKEEEKKEGKGKKKKEKQIPINTYIDINLKNEWLEGEANSVLSQGIKLDTPYTGHKILVDFSSPNIAKEMHVGHLRSTILGDSICRILEFLNNDVFRANHVGDFGTQFGMLIAYLEFINPDYAVNPEKSGNIRDLEEFYKNAKKKFDAEPEFKKKSQLKIVDLQKGDEKTVNAWKFICQISRENFNEIYRRLDIKIEEVGESFYNPLCKELIPILEEQKIIEESEGAKVLKIKGEKVPLLCVKSDGGIGYDTTDLAALKYRLVTIGRDWIIYVVGGEQEEHLRKVFKAGEICGWHKPPTTRLDHMAFGMVTGMDGKKLATRKGGNVKLSALLDQAWEDSKAEMKKRNEKNNAGMTEEYINEASEKLGYSAVKYFDLKQFRTSNYKFDWDKMLDDRGNTAVYLFYSYVRICAIYRKLELKDEDIVKLINTEKITISDKYDKSLVMHLLRFNDVIEDVLNFLAINLLYL